jgi:hypothetical protein
MYQSFPLTLELNFANYISASCSGSIPYPIIPSHTQDPNLTWDFPLLIVACDSYTEEISGFSVYKADMRIDTITNIYDSSSVQIFDNVDYVLNSVMYDQDSVRNYINNPSSSLFVAGVFLEGNYINQSVDGSQGYCYINTRRYSVFAQQNYPDANIMSP